MVLSRRSGADHRAAEGHRGQPGRRRRRSRSARRDRDRHPSQHPADQADDRDRAARRSRRRWRHCRRRRARCARCSRPPATPPTVTLGGDGCRRAGTPTGSRTASRCGPRRSGRGAGRARRGGPGDGVADQRGRRLLPGHRPRHPVRGRLRRRPEDARLPAERRDRDAGRLVQLIPAGPALDPAAAGAPAPVVIERSDLMARHSDVDRVAQVDIH